VAGAKARAAITPVRVSVPKPKHPAAIQSCLCYACGDTGCRGVGDDRRSDP